MHWKAWGQYLAIAGTYGACYQLAYHLSASHWALTAGLRLSCLLLIPIRFWPALAIGEFLPFVENALLCMHQFGPTWALVASVPNIVLCMAAMKPMRQRWALRASDGRINMSYLVIATLCCAMLGTLRDTAGLWVLLATSTTNWGPSVSVSIGFSAYLLGNYLGALTLAPCMLAIHDRVGTSIPSVRAFLRSPLFRDTWSGLLPVLVLLVWWANTAEVDSMRQIARLTTVVPLAFMAWRHGWHGAAVAGMGASIAVAMTSTVARDPAVIYCQIVLAIVISLCLLVGGKTQRATRPAMQTF